MKRFPLFRLALAGLMSRGSGWLLLGGAVVFTWLAPLVAPWEENPQILQPARAQAVWTYAWLALLTWLPFQAAALGHRLRAEGMLEHAHAAGTGRASLGLQLGGAVLVWLLALALIAAVLTATWCLPRRAGEAGLWLQLVGQYAVLYLLCASPLVLLATALGTRTAEVIAFLVPTGLLISGLFGAAWLAPLLGGSSAKLLQSLWLAVPHYHLADLTPRLVFKMGPLPAADFLASAGVLALQGLALSLTGLCLFRTRS